MPTQLQKLHLCTHPSSAGEQTHVTPGRAQQSLNGRDIVVSSQENFMFHGFSLTPISS